MPTSITARLASKVLPRPIGRLVRGVANAPNFAVNRALSKLAPSRQTTRSVTLSPSAGFGFRAPPRPSFANMLTQPTAYPSSGQMLSPAYIPAVAASVGAPIPSSGISTGWGGGGGGGGYDGEGGDAGGAYDERGDAGAYDEGGGSEDPTDEMPDDFFASRDDDGADLGSIDYHAALEGLGDWKSDLSSFGKTAALNIGKQAITTIGGKLTAAGKPIPPPVQAAGIPMAAKVAAGAVVALGIGYALTRRSGASV